MVEDGPMTECYMDRQQNKLAHVVKMGALQDLQLTGWSKQIPPEIEK